ncbi:MAG: prephenate dehydratase, partial [Patescibacteria group bacterium]|nr:prephenate dehydratase [Patescibacteria group bacterium]
AERRPVGVSASKRGASSESDLAQLDRELLRLVQDRGKLVLQMAEEGVGPQGSDLAVGLEDGQLAGILERIEGPLSRRSVRAVFREVVSGCRSLVRPTRVALLGPQYSYSHLAALGHFGQAVEFVPVGTIPAVFEEVNRRHSDFGVVPVENSTDGRIADTLDMFTRLPVRICGQIEMNIHHTLLGKCRREEVAEVYSKPQALSQCRNWLAKHMPTARPIEVTSTSTAAQLAAEKPGTAAIASLQAGVHYGLDVLAERIEDNPANLTRFALIGDHSPVRTGNDQTALLFQTEHRFGALVDVLAVFKRCHLSLTWIESFPVPGPGRLYLFFVEVEGHETDLLMQKALKAIKEKTFRLEVLGSYPAPNPIDS